jgi:YidC/Oxa1 family membrane protein insertase
METRRLIIALALGMGLILLYQSMLPWIDRQMHWDSPRQAISGGSAQTEPSTEPATEPSTQAVAGTASSASTQSASQPAGGAPGIMAAAGAAQVVPATQPAVNPIEAELGSSVYKDKQFAVQLDVQSLGAGLGSVTLNDFHMTAAGKEPYEFEKPLVDRLDTEPLGSHSITVDNVAYDLAGVHWSLVNRGPSLATYGADLIQNGKKLLELRKTYSVVPRSEPNLGFEVRVEFEFANATDARHTIRAAFNGPTLPPKESYRPPDRQVVAGYTVDKDGIEVQLHPIEEFKPDKNGGAFDLTKDPKGRPVRWAGAVSNNFAAIVVPLEMRVNGATTHKTDYIGRITAQGVNIEKDVPMDDHQAFVSFETTDIPLDPHGSATLPMSVYFGPKAKQISGYGTVLESSYYSAYPRRFDLLTTIRSSMCGISLCSFDWLTNALQWLLVNIHFVVRDWGLAIIVLVAIVRLILHPITRRSQISMSKMSKMGPEMKRLQEKYKDDKESLNKAMMEFHREQGLGPYLGCLPMFLQMPIWIALYGVLQSTFELRHAPFLWNLTWIHDLAQPDNLITFSHPVHLIFFDIHSFNLLPLLLAGVMMIQQQFMPKPAAATPEQMQQQKMMQYLSPAMFLFFFYPYPSGLNLYIFASTGIGIIESKIVRDHLKAREEAEKAGRVFVETKPTRAARQGRLTMSEEKPPRRGLIGALFAAIGRFWGNMLEQAEQVRKEKERKGKS